MAAGKLSIVASPIGNLADITHRALDTLRTADIIACEDTRHSRRLLDHYGINSAKLLSLHAHNEAARSASLVAEIASGKKVAYLSDAGTPTISDPGARLVAACLRSSTPYEIIPGASAVVTALAGSGLISGPFYFGGFLPNKSGGRENTLRAALDRPEPSAFYESPHRIVRSLAVLADLDPGRLVCVARELTKRHEEFSRGSAATLHTHYRDHPPKGEITLVVSGTDLAKFLRADVTSPDGQDPG